MKGIMDNINSIDIYWLQGNKDIVRGRWMCIGGKASYLEYLQ